MGLQGEDEPTIMLTKKIPSSGTQGKPKPRFPPRCPPFQKQKHQPEGTENAILSTRKSRRNHKPSSWYSSESYVLGNKKPKVDNPPQLIGFMSGDISPRISPNQLKKKKIAEQIAAEKTTAAPTPTKTVKAGPSSSTSSSSSINSPPVKRRNFFRFDENLIKSKGALDTSSSTDLPTPTYTRKSNTRLA